MSTTIDLIFVRKRIDEKGLKINFLASKIGVTKNTLSSFLNGRRNLGLSALKLLMLELGISEEQLFKAS